MRILLTGGGTGGHIMPILAVVKSIKKITKREVEFLLVGLVDQDSKTILENEGIRVKNIACGKFRRYFSIKNFTDLFKIPVGLIQAFWHVYIFMPDVTFSKGGYASIPGSFASWFFRIPILSHESDTVPGLSNKFIGKLSKIVAVAFQKPFEYFSKKKTVLLGNPIRQEIFLGSAEKCRGEFSIALDRTIIFVIGGSQGAVEINKAVLGILSQLVEKADVIHQCGRKDFENVKQRAAEILGQDFEKKGYHPRDFISNELSDIFAGADLVITRAGANVLSEIAVSGKPSIIIPLLSSAGDHQKENAFEFTKAGASIVIEHSNLTSGLFLAEINKILDSSDLAKAMGDNAKKLAHPDASDKIAELILKLGGA